MLVNARIKLLTQELTEPVSVSECVGVIDLGGVWHNGHVNGKSRTNDFLPY